MRIILFCRDSVSAQSRLRSLHYPQVYIGCYGNTRTCIIYFEKCSDINADFFVHQYVSDQDTLSGTEFRSFWIEWDDRTLKVGKGERVGLEHLTEHTWDNSMSVEAIFIGGYGNAAFDLVISKQLSLTMDTLLQEGRREIGKVKSRKPICLLTGTAANSSTFVLMQLAWLARRYVSRSLLPTLNV